MCVNIDGLREGLTDDLNRLGEALREAFNDSDTVDIDILEFFDNVAQNVNFLNCVFDNENESFNDMSEKKARFISED